MQVWIGARYAGPWLMLALASMLVHLAIELLIRGSIRWDLILGSSSALATALVLAGLAPHRRASRTA